MAQIHYAATAVVTLSLFAAPAALAGNKSDVCHPAGNSGNVLTLNVNNNAVPAHLAHGDWLPITFYGDADGDGYGDAGDTTEACEQPAGTATNGDDCDDDDAGVHPGAAETPYDGVDNDCDAGTPDDDLDGDGFGIADDCDDGDDAVHPAAVEVCGDGIDNDCDGGDESCFPPQIWNAADDFTHVSNPHGEWSYGYTNALGGFSLFTSYGSLGRHLEFWNRGFFWLQVYANRTSNTYGNCNDWCLLPGTIAMHPDNSDLKAVTRFTAPADGEYDVTGQFRPIDRQSSSIEVWVLHNGSVVVHGYLGAWWTTVPFAETLDLEAGDTVDFVVGRGGGGYFNDGTDLEATIDGPY